MTRLLEGLFTLSNTLNLDECVVDGQWENWRSWRLFPHSAPLSTRSENRSRFGWTIIISYKSLCFVNPSRCVYSKDFTIFTLLLIHLVYPQKFCLSIVFHFSWDDLIPRRNWKQWFCKIWAGGGGVNEVFYEPCGRGEAEMVHRTVSCSKVG